MSQSTLLDTIVNTPADAPEPDAAEMSRRAELVTAALAGGTATMVPGEQDPTTRTALAEFYDGKRDAAVGQLAGIVKNYGAEVEKRGQGMTAAIAAPLLAEMRKALDRADAMQVRAATHRRAIA